MKNEKLEQLRKYYKRSETNFDFKPKINKVSDMIASTK